MTKVYADEWFWEFPNAETEYSNVNAFVREILWDFFTMVGSVYESIYFENDSVYIEWNGESNYFEFDGIATSDDWDNDNPRHNFSATIVPAFTVPKDRDWLLRTAPPSVWARISKN